MPKTQTLAAAILSGLGLFAGCAAMADTSAGSSDVSCRVERTEASGTQTLLAVAQGPSGTTGAYEFSVIKSGGGGSSRSAQSGEFEIGPDGKVVLSDVQVGSGGGITTETVLTVTTSSGTCEAR